jgi:NAD(P)-dependent dehydrogenase (short-subunit alcohol dehydrogenase family)
MPGQRFLRDKVALVTGGGRGLGAATARALAGAGAAVAVAARTDTEIGAVARRIRKAGGEAPAVPADVTDYEAVEELVARVLDAFPRIDFLVNMAGAAEPLGVPSWEADPDAWAQTVDANLTGVFHTCRAVVPHMLAEGAGRILNISSPAGQRPIPLASAYCATKAAVDHFSRVLAAELEETGVTVNTFNLGPTDTPVLHQVYDTLYPDRAEALKRYMRPPREAASLVLWLCAPGTARLTGEHLEWTDRRARRWAALHGYAGARA